MNTHENCQRWVWQIRYKSDRRAQWKRMKFGPPRKRMLKNCWHRMSFGRLDVTTSHSPWATKALDEHNALPTALHGKARGWIGWNPSKLMASYLAMDRYKLYSVPTYRSNHQYPMKGVSYGASPQLKLFGLHGIGIEVWFSYVRDWGTLQ